MSIGPELSTVDIFYITKYSKIVFGCVFTPTCDCNIFPKAIPATGFYDLYMVMAISQKVYFGQSCIGRIDVSYLNIRFYGICFDDVGCVCVENRSSWYTFLQKQKSCIKSKL